MPGGALQVIVENTVFVVMAVVSVVSVVSGAAAEEEVAMTETGADMEEGEQSVYLILALVNSPTGTMVTYRKYNMNIVVRQWYSGELYP